MLSPSLWGIQDPKYVKPSEKDIFLPVRVKHLGEFTSVDEWVFVVDVTREGIG